MNKKIRLSTRIVLIYENNYKNLLKVPATNSPILIVANDPTAHRNISIFITSSLNLDFIIDCLGGKYTLILFKIKEILQMV